MYLEIRNGAYFLCDVLLNFSLSFQMKNFETNKNYERFKANDKFINLVNQFCISKSTVVFKISIVRFLNNYPKMRKYLHFLNNNFKINKDICKENTSEFK